MTFLISEAVCSMPPNSIINDIDHDANICHKIFLFGGGSPLFLFDNKITPK